MLRLKGMLLPEERTELREELAALEEQKRRLAKYDQVLRIEEELRSDAKYTGKDFYRPK